MHHSPFNAWLLPLAVLGVFRHPPGFSALAALNTGLKSADQPLKPTLARAFFYFRKQQFEVSTRSPIISVVELVESALNGFCRENPIVVSHNIPVGTLDGGRFLLACEREAEPTAEVKRSTKSILSL